MESPLSWTESTYCQQLFLARVFRFWTRRHWTAAEWEGGWEAWTWKRWEKGKWSINTMIEVGNNWVIHWLLIYIVAAVGTNMTCQTINSVDCVFPFTYHGQVFHQCSTMDNNNIPWCATMVDYQGDVHGDWDNCGAGCSQQNTSQSSTTTSITSNITLSICKTSSGPDVVGRDCVFPFIYKSEKHDECTAKDNFGNLWCATQVDSHGNYMDGKWGNCSIGCTSKVQTEQFKTVQSVLFLVDLEFESLLTEVTNRSQLLMVDMVLAMEQMTNIIM